MSARKCLETVNMAKMGAHAYCSRTNCSYVFTCNLQVLEIKFSWSSFFFFGVRNHVATQHTNYTIDVQQVYCYHRRQKYKVNNVEDVRMGHLTTNAYALERIAHSDFILYTSFQFRVDRSLPLIIVPSNAKK